MAFQLASDNREPEWEWKHAVEEEATDPWEWLDVQERKRRIALEAGAEPLPLPPAVEAYVLSRYRVGFIGAGEETVRVVVADTLAGVTATGIVGFPIDVTSDQEAFPAGVLLAGIDQAAIGTVAPPTLRLFQLDEASNVFTLCPSGISVTGAATWGRITRPGRYVLIGCDGRDAVNAVVRVLACVRPHILREDFNVRHHVLTAMLEGLLLSSAIGTTVDEVAAAANENGDAPIQSEQRDGGDVRRRTSISTLRDLVDRFARDQEPPEAQLLRLIGPR